MKVLVTGGAGFIGSNIVDRLVELGHEVAVVDNLSTGKKENVNPQARFYKVDICDGTLQDVFDKEKPDIVNHQAAQASVTVSTRYPIIDAFNNILGSINVLENCERTKVSKVIYASSGGAVYGHVLSPPASEAALTAPVCQYGVSKYTVERYLKLYWVMYQLKYVVLRYANAYGKRQRPDGEAGVVAIFANQMLNGTVPMIYGDGNKTRDYVHVSDVVEANVLAMDHGLGVFNIGTGIETRDREMFDAVAKATGYKGEPRYTAVRPGEVMRTALDSGKAKELLGWVPKVKLDDGVRETVKYYRGLRACLS